MSNDGARGSGTASGGSSLTSLLGKASKVDPKLAGKIAQKTAKKFGLSPDTANMVGSQVTSQMQKQKMQNGTHAPGNQHSGGVPPQHNAYPQHHQGGEAYPPSSTGPPPGYPSTGYPPAQQPYYPPAQPGGGGSGFSPSSGGPPPAQGGAYPSI